MSASGLDTDDAAMRQVELYTSQGCTRTAHPSYPPQALLQKTWRLNKALDRWLDYLLRQGHSMATMAPA